LRSPPKNLQNHGRSKIDVGVQTHQICISTVHDKYLENNSSKKKKLRPMTDNQRSKSQHNLSSASPQRKLGFSLWVPERARRENLAPQDNPRFKSEKTHHLLHQSHCEIPGGEKKTLERILLSRTRTQDSNQSNTHQLLHHSGRYLKRTQFAPQDNPRFKSQYNKSSSACFLTVENTRRKKKTPRRRDGLVRHKTQSQIIYFLHHYGNQ
jgi:hypothetical protein